MDQAHPQDDGLEQIEAMNAALDLAWREQLHVEPSLTRALVSFQQSKHQTVYRWFKYKEAFSPALIEDLLRRYGVTSGTLLDPFAGSGTALFAARGKGIRAEGIELLPIGLEIIAAKQRIDTALAEPDLRRIADWARDKPWRTIETAQKLPELRITQGAYTAADAHKMAQYRAAAAEESAAVRQVLEFALLCILESVSFTRKDGQYLRWDFRAERRQSARPFNKGVILPFDEAIAQKLIQIVRDLAQQNHAVVAPKRSAPLHVHAGSCLKILPTLAAGSYDAIVTSPPYCNRYDYTRTYALELALLGVDEERLSALRQEMLSCTVENRAKDLLQLSSQYAPALAAADAQPALQAILAYLSAQKATGKLNNKAIPRMVRGYFYEMACVISQCARVLKPGAPLLMVNDNVRYCGASIPVDIILSTIAQELGFRVETILVLPGGKGNSSQQMGAHGRNALRKCVYVWRKA